VFVAIAVEFSEAAFFDIKVFAKVLIHRPSSLSHPYHLSIIPLTFSFPDLLLFPCSLPFTNDFPYFPFFSDPILIIGYYSLQHAISAYTAILSRIYIITIDHIYFG
jgi:hypothetical protein